MSDSNKALAEIKTTTGKAMVQAMAEQSETIAILKKYIQQNMVPDEDYGLIPGTKNETLLLPGAEKIAALFRCIPSFTCTHRQENFETGLFSYEWACTFSSIDDGKPVSNGIGSANSYESKWRWRTAARKCPACGKDTIIKQKEEKGGNWLCLGNDKGGCWAKFSKDDPKITGQVTGKVQNENLSDLVNTVLKISKKRALVDCAAAICRRFGFNFAVDMEDVKANEEERGREYDHTEPEREVITPITEATLKKLVDAMVSINIGFNMPKYRKWFATEVLKQEIGDHVKLADLTETEGRAMIKAVLFLIEDKAKKAAAAGAKPAEPAKEPEKTAEPPFEPITPELVQDIDITINTLGRTWAGAVANGWAGKIVGHPVAEGTELTSISKADGEKLKVALEDFLRSRQKK
jgi:hypothetical protein